MPTCDLAVGLGGRLPVDDDGAGFALLAHHGHVLGGRGGHCNTNHSVSTALARHRTATHLRLLVNKTFSFLLPSD